MIGAAIQHTVPDDLVDTFIAWRLKEGELARKQPGFIKRSMTRDTENPNVFHYLTFWESIEHIEAFTATPEFKRAVEESGIRDVYAQSEMIRHYVTEVFFQEAE